jgi:hypothetical protein
MDMIIGRFLTPFNSSRAIGRVRWRDDNSRRNVQNLRRDSVKPHRVWHQLQATVDDRMKVKWTVFHA